MNERIKELAEQAGFDSEAQTVCAFDYFDLEHFAELVRQDEAKACAEHSRSGNYQPQPGYVQAIFPERETEQAKDGIYGTAKFWLEEGWYTIDDLEGLLEHNRKMNEHLQESMKPIEESK
jgi:hypothetical protein